MNNSTQTHPSLNILLWNANGTIQLKHELHNLLYEKKNDIAMINKTHFTLNTNFKLHGFTTHVTNHPNNTAYAGIGIVVSSRIRHCLLPPFQEHAIRATNIKINVNSIPITLSSVYCPPPSNHNISKNKFNSLFSSLGNTFIGGGDFNAKHNSWRCRAENQRGKILFQTITDNHFSYFPSWSNLLAHTFK
jgi:exonuclease III